MPGMIARSVSLFFPMAFCLYAAVEPSNFSGLQWRSANAMLHYVSTTIFLPGRAGFWCIAVAERDRGA